MSLALFIGHAHAIKPQEVKTLINQYRVQHGLWPLRKVVELDESALEQSLRMCRMGGFDHNKNWPLDIQSTGYKYEVAGENIAWTTRGAEYIVDMWVHSPHHLENIMDTRWTETGIGIVHCGDREYLTQHFAKPTLRVMYNYGTQVTYNPQQAGKNE